MRKKSGWTRKIVLTAILGIGVSVGTVYADNSLQTTYHVYVGDKHLGVVDDKSVVKSYVEKRLDKAEHKYNKLDVNLREDLSFVPEKTFTPSSDNDQVVDALKQDLSVAVDAVGLTVNGETVAYLPSEEKAEKVVEQLKENYVKPEKLQKLEKRKAEGAAPNIKLGESAIIDVALTKKVSKEEEPVKPSSVDTVPEAVKTLQKGTSEEKIHTVKKGEFLGEIADKYDLSTKELQSMNPKLKEDGLLHIGQKLNVTDVVPLTEVLIKEKGVKKETIKHDTKVVKTDKLYKGETKVKQAGKDGEKKVHYFINKKNDQVVEKGTTKEETISKPVDKIILKGTKVIPSRGTGDFDWPAVGGVITSHQGKRWGEYHKGIDIAGVSNRTIKAADNGVVVSAGYTTGGYGNKIVINHKNGYETLYGHLASISVHPGQKVKRGQKIGVMGTTGDSTGIHLHFEIHKHGSLKNPESFY